MDEHRVGLKPIIRRTWSLRGVRPVVSVDHRYEWLYVYGFVRPLTGQSFWLLMPTVSIDAYNSALAAFAESVELGPNKRVDLFVDRAGWHVSPQVECPIGLCQLFLPSHSPELQPAEHLWPLTDVPLANRCFKNLAELEAVLGERCNWLQDHPELLRSATNFHWWPQVA